MTLKIVIPSKNRPQQLRLLFTSMRKFFPKDLAERTSIYVDYTDRRFKAGYEKLKAEKIWPCLWNYSDIPGELSPKWHIDNSICNSGTDYTLLLTDDSLFISECLLNRSILNEVFSYRDTLCFSLRLGLNTTTIDYTNSKLKEQPLDLENTCTFPNIISWDWKNRRGGHFGYPIGLDGTIIETKELQRLSNDVERNNYRQWEGNLSDYARRFNKTKNWAFKHSCLVNIPVNQVADAGQLKNGVYCPYSAEVLNDLYLDNIIIDPERVYKQAFCGSVSQEWGESPFMCDTVQREIRFPFTTHKKWWSW